MSPVSRLSSRPDYNTVIADRFMRRCNEVHQVEWKANVRRGSTAAGDELLAEDIPLVGGTLTLDSSDPIRRQLTLEVGGGEEWAPRTPDSPLVPFGQRINLWVRIDEADGSGWFPWIHMGEYHIVTHTFERPSYITTVECVDMAGAVDEFLMMRRRSFVGETIHDAIKDLCEDAVPGYVFAVDSSDAAKDPDKALKNYVTDAGQGRWEVCREIASRRGHECFFDCEGNLVIRHDVTDDNDDSIPGNGPDIGTVSDPVATIRDGDGGNMIGITATLSRQGGCNGVRINLHSTVPRKVRKKINREPQAPLPDGASPEEFVAWLEEKARRENEGPWRTEWEDAPINAFAQELQESGQVAWGGLFGKLPIVIERDVKDLKKWSDGGEETWSNVQADAHRDAKRILHRRRGVIRFLDLHTLPLYWLEPDDKVRIRWMEHEDDPTAGPEDVQMRYEAHFVQRVEFDLSGEGPMVLRTRQLNVVDPGPGPVP